MSEYANLLSRNEHLLLLLRQAQKVVQKAKNMGVQKWEWVDTGDLLIAIDAVLAGHSSQPLPDRERSPPEQPAGGQWAESGTYGEAPWRETDGFRVDASYLNSLERQLAEQRRRAEQAEAQLGPSEYGAHLEQDLAKALRKLAAAKRALQEIVRTHDAGLSKPLTDIARAALSKLEAGDE